jgi:regulator of protease activity HflC (stomatin/prohibitin superfamily)
VGWGVHIDRVEIKDVALPESMKRSMSRQAEAERERRARVISADGELQASEKLALAAAAMSRHPAALQLRLLETVVAGGVGEELDVGAAVPGGAAAVPGGEHRPGDGREPAEIPPGPRPVSPEGRDEPAAG